MDCFWESTTGGGSTDRSTGDGGTGSGRGTTCQEPENCEAKKQLWSLFSGSQGNLAPLTVKGVPFDSWSSYNPDTTAWFTSEEKARAYGWQRYPKDNWLPAKEGGTNRFSYWGSRSFT